MKKFISIDMADGDAQTDAMEQLIETYPDLRIAIGHFGMVTTDGWENRSHWQSMNMFISKVAGSPGYSTKNFIHIRQR